MKYAFPVGQFQQNELFSQQIVQYSQGNEDDDFHYHLLGLDESSTEDDMKKIYHKLSLKFHSDKNNHSQASAVMRMINEAKEELEDTLRYNYAKRKKEHVCMTQNYIQFFV